MGLIPIIVLKWVEILRLFHELRRRFERKLQASTGQDCFLLRRSALERIRGLEKKTDGRPFRTEVESRDITKGHWKSPSGLSLSVLPCQVPVNDSYPLSHLRFLSLLD